MAREYAPIFLDWPTVTRELNAQEKGRLIDAIVAYQAGGDWQEQIKGNERYVFPGYQSRIDRWNEISDARAKARKPEQTGTNDNKPEQTGTNDNKNAKVKSKKDKDIKENVNDAGAHAGEEMPFGITGEEIHASLARDSQIEDAAKSAGLNTSETAMVTARRYADEYGLEKLLEAIKKTPLQAQKPSWAYVEGILKGGKTNDNRGNHSGVPGNGGTSGKYAHLFDGTAV